MYKKWKQRADSAKTRGKFQTLASTGKYTTLVERERKDYQASKAKWRSKEGFKSYIGKATLSVNAPKRRLSERGPYMPRIGIENFRDKQDPSKFVGKGWQM